MKSLFPSLFHPPAPVHSDPEKKLQAWFLNYILRSLIVVLLTLFGVWLFSSEPFDPFNLLTDLVLLILIGIMVLLVVFAQRGYLIPAGTILVVSLWFGMAYIAWAADGVRDLALLGHFITILIAGLILGWQASILVAVCSAGFIYGLTILQLNGTLHPTLQPFQEYARDLGSVLILMAVITVLVIRSIKKVLEELRLSDERFRNAFENAPIGMAIVGLDDQILQANQALCDMLGYARGQLTSTSISAITHPEDRLLEKTHKEEMHSAEKTSFSLVKRYLHADGHVVWGRLNVSLAFDANGQPLYYLGQLEDITEYKQTEDELKKTHDILQAVVNVSPLAIDLIDAEQKIRLWSPAAEKLWGWKADEVLGRDIAVILGTQTLEIKQQIEQELQGNIRQSFEVRRSRKDGSMVDVILWVATLRGQNNDIQGIVTFLADDTERKKIQRELEDNRRRLAFLLEKSPSVVYSSRASGDFGATFVSANVAKQLGYQPEEFTGNPNFWIEHIHPDDAPRVFEELNKLFENGTHTHEYRFLHQNGHYLWMRDELTLIRGDDGDPREIIGSWIDITDQKQAEAERENLIQELTLKNSELERFTYTVSHDLKAPLITIAGFLGYLELDAASGNIERMRADTRRIQDAVQKMERLLNELLELSRIGRIVNPPQNIAFNDLIQEALELLHGRLEARRARVVVQSDLPMVSGDLPRLLEVLQNIIDNALKFTSDQSQPVIEIGQRGSEQEKPIFFIRDNGIGIESKHHDRIFGLFNKLDARSEGTGIGLALVKRIVEVHGGRIWVESEAGAGSTFLFTLPTQPPPDSVI